MPGASVCVLRNMERDPPVKRAGGPRRFDTHRGHHRPWFLGLGARSVLSPFVLGALWTMDQDPGRTRTQARRTRTRSYTELQIALVVQVWLQWHLANCFVDRAIL